MGEDRRASGWFLCIQTEWGGGCPTRARGPNQEWKIRQSPITARCCFRNPGPGLSSDTTRKTPRRPQEAKRPEWLGSIPAISGLFFFFFPFFFFFRTATGSFKILEPAP